MITGLIVRPGADGELIEIRNPSNPAEMQRIIGGYFEVMMSSTWHAFMLEDGTDAEGNLFATMLIRVLAPSKMGSVRMLLGPVVFVGASGDEVADVPDLILAARTDLRTRLLASTNDE